MNNPNKVTDAAIKEGRKLAAEPSVTGYRNIKELKEALEQFTTSSLMENCSKVRKFTTAR